MISAPAPSRAPLRDAFTLSLVESDGTVRYQSSAIEGLLGYEPDQLAGTAWFQLLREEDAPRVREQFAALIAKGADSGRWIVRLRSATGSWQPIEVRARNLVSDPEVNGVLLSLRALPAVRHVM